MLELAANQICFNKKKKFIDEMMEKNTLELIQKK